MRAFCKIIPRFNLTSICSSQFGPNEQTFVLPLNAVIEVAFIGTPGHAFHLQYVSMSATAPRYPHQLCSGHAFSVVQSASGGPPNFVNPPRRDVTASGGTTDNPMRIRFKTDNPGPWYVLSFKG